jgi:myo-inositol-1(or 4)-monophosphatase
MKPAIDELIRLAKGAGTILRDGFGQQHEIKMKGIIDLVTEVDKQAEDYLISKIHNMHPGDMITGEESGVHNGKSGGGQWLIDPLDGTLNYAHGVPIFSVSIAYAFDGIIELGVVFDPMQNECFSAERGKGAFLNGRKLEVSAVDQMVGAMLCTGFPYDVHTSPENNLNYFTNFVLKAQAVRRLGSAALDLCYVAAGRLDGFWELSLNAWDIAAGVLMVEEAGGVTSTMDGKPIVLEPPYSIVASNPAIHAQMMGIIKKS